MSRTACLIAVLALAAAGVAIHLVIRERSARIRAETRISSLEGMRISEISEDLLIWNTRRGIPRPLQPPNDLAGVGRIRWTRRELDVGGWDREKCRQAGGRAMAGVCSFPVASNSAGNGSTPGEPRAHLPPLDESEGRIEAELLQIGGTLTPGKWMREGNVSAIEISIRIDVPTVQGVGAILRRLEERPFVLSDLEWAGGLLSISGQLIGGA